MQTLKLRACQSCEKRTAAGRKLSDRAWNVMFGALMVSGCALLVFFVYLRYASVGEYRLEYEGRVVRKSLTVVETQTGSVQRLRLHIRPTTGSEFQVAVNRGLYERAQEGMWIKRSREGVQLSWDAP